MFTRLEVIVLINKHTNKQTPLKTSNTLRYATTLGNDGMTFDQKQTRYTAHLCHHPVFNHLHDGLHHFGVLRLVDQSNEDRSDERLAHVQRHRSDAVLDEIQTQNQQLAGDVAVIRCRRSQVLARHALQHSHERCDQPVDVARIVHARCLQDHQRAKQL